MIYRLLCCSDTHAEIPPIIDEAGALAWLHGGDVANGPTSLGDGSDPSADPLRAEASNWFRNRTVPIFVVRGNHDVCDELWAFRRTDDISGRIVQLAPRLFVAGIGWHGERYFELPYESDVRQVCESIRRVARRVIMPQDRLVILTHYPPRFPAFREVTGDRDGGGVWFDCIRELVEELRPLAVIQGHVHRWFRTSHPVSNGESTTLVISPGPRGAALTVNVETGEASFDWLSPD